MLTWLTAGESHGEQLLGILDGVPSGIHITTQDFRYQLARRRSGVGRGARQKFEQDCVYIVGGLRHGVTTGAPIGITIDNTEWPRWEVVMSPDPVDSALLHRDAGKGDKREIARQKPLTRPRPGHADLVGMLGYDLDDARPVLERASARETAMRVALATVARALLCQAADIHLVSHVTNIGGVHLPSSYALPSLSMAEEIENSPVRCLDPHIAQEMIERIHTVKKQGDTLGGDVEVIAYNLPIGMGSHTQYFRRLDARLASALMSIQAVKAVGIGDGNQLGSVYGSHAHDEIVPMSSLQADAIYHAENSSHSPMGMWKRASNHAGGLEGGMTTGSPLRVSATMKPISTVPHPLSTLDMSTMKPAQAIHQRSDVCAVVPLAVIAEAMVALTLANVLLEDFGGKNIRDISERISSYSDRIRQRFSLPHTS